MTVTSGGSLGGHALYYCALPVVLCRYLVFFKSKVPVSSGGSAVDVVGTARELELGVEPDDAASGLRSRAHILTDDQLLLRDEQRTRLRERDSLARTL